MTCLEVLNSLELYLKGELDNKTKTKLEEHINKCPECMKASLDMEDIMNKIKKVYDNISLPPQLDNVESLLPKETEKRKKKANKKWLSIASIFIIVFFVAVSPIMANMIQSIPLFEKYLVHDKGIVNSLENGFGQQIEKQDIKEGVRLTVHNVVSDENRTVVIFSIKLPEETHYDYGQIQRAFITNSFGKEIESSGYSYRFDKETDTLTGKFEAESLGFWDNKLEFNINGLKLTREKNIPIYINKPNLKISNYIEGIEKLTIDKIEFNDDKGILKYTVILKDKSYNYLNPRIELYSNGKQINAFLESSRVYDKKTEDYMIFEVGDTNPEHIEAILKVNSLDTNLDSVWKVGFKVDRNLAENNTIVKEINKRINAGYGEITIEKMVITPSQTQIYVKKPISESKPLRNGDSQIIRYMMDEIRLVTQGKELYMKGSSMESHEGNYQVTAYKFDPITTNMEDIKLIFEKSRKIIHENKQVFLNAIDYNKKLKSVGLGDYLLDISYKKEKGDLIITVDTKEKDFDMVNGAYININGEKKFADEITTSLAGYKRRKGNQTTIVFENYKDKEADFYISAYSIFDDNKYEVQLVE